MKLLEKIAGSDGDLAKRFIRMLGFPCRKSGAGLWVTLDIEQPEASHKFRNVGEGGSRRIFSGLPIGAGGAQ